MNVQLIDQHDRPSFRMYTSEPVWERFWTHARAFAAPIEDPPTRDFTLSPSSLAVVAQQLEADLASAKQGIQEVQAPGQTSHVEVLGDVLRLNLRVESHAYLQRLALLHHALSRIVADQAPIRVAFVPQLESSQYYLAALLQREPKGLRRDQVKSALMQEYERLIASDAATDELRVIWMRARDALHDDTVMNEILVGLTTWSLIRESPEDMRIVATPKLLLIAL